MTENEVVGWHHQLNEHEFEQTPGDGATERLHFHFSLACIGEGNGNPLQCSCLELPQLEMRPTSIAPNPKESRYSHPVLHSSPREKE